MKYKEIRKTKRYKTERTADGAAITRSSFQFLYFIILLLFVFALVFGVFFRIASFNKKIKGSDNKLVDKNYSVITIKSDKYKKGDIVTYISENKISAGEIVALNGEKITVQSGSNRPSPYDHIVYKGIRFFDVDALNAVIDDACVPEGYVLVNGDLTSSENTKVGRIICEKDITGKAAYILYPFSLFGRTADYLKR